jgi:hypothetical protein
VVVLGWASTLQDEKKERWQELCQLAVVEQDPARLIELVHEIEQLLEEKQQRLTGCKKPRESGT